jgi:hypothetical protein
MYQAHTLVLLNMGAILDLPSEEWFGALDDQISVHIIDSNRPQNLSSLFGSVGVGSGQYLCNTLIFFYRSSSNYSTNLKLKIQIPTRIPTSCMMTTKTKKILPCREQVEKDELRAALQATMNNKFVST